jgi:hypothetical protein
VKPSLALLYSSDNWDRRRRLLFNLIWWKVALATAIIVFAAWTNSENAILQLALPALLTAIAAEATAYIFGANQDDANKREKLPPPKVDNDAGLKPPDGFGE